MMETIWTFKTRNFTVVCDEEEQGFVDPWVHGQETIDAADIGNCIIKRLIARVDWKSVKVGHGTLSDCIYDIANDGYTIISDRSYRYKVLRRAISDARESLAEIEGVPDLYLRKTA